MAKTLTSSTTAYCTGAQALLFVDKRLWGDLLKDDGTRDTNPAANATLGDLLLAASGDVEAACLRAHKYEVVDLQAIAAANPKTAMTNKLAELVAWLAYEKCQGRRQPQGGELLALQNARRLLKDLHDGVEVFGFVETQDAGLPDTADTRPPGSEYDQNRAVYKARRFFGRHGSGWSDTW
jgi:hypothetical protein